MNFPLMCLILSNIVIKRNIKIVIIKENQGLRDF